MCGPVRALRWSRYLQLLVLLRSLSVASAKVDYIYKLMPKGESDPVIEYVPPPDNYTKNNLGGSELQQPSFLYSTTGPAAAARVVEFYAPWCPHCQHFAPKYVQFARRMQDLVKPYGVQVDFYAVSCTINNKLCQKLGIHGYPTVKVLAAGSANATTTKYYDLHPFQILRDIGIAVDMVDVPEEPVEEERGRHLKTNKDPKGKKYVLAQAGRPKRTKAEIYADAYKSFHFAMQTGVFMATGPLPNDTVPVLDSWLSLLQDTLPPTWNIQPLIKKLLDEFDNIILGEDQLQQVLDQFPPSSTEWSFSCTHGVEAMGYTCGLWELFHIMTVGVVEYNEKVITDDGYSFYRTEAVAEDLRNYIANFFACDVCRMNFLHSFDNCGLDRCNRLSDKAGDSAAWKQLPLWLFELHNAVNVRLMKEQAERDNRETTRDDEIKVRWPSRLDCPKCWHFDGSWDEDIVYLYLLDQYWPDEGRASETSRRAQFQSVVTLEKEDIDDETEGSLLTRLAIYGPLLALAATIAYFYKKKADLWKTGRHKKRDY